MLRAAKNANGVIICIGNDEGDSGDYPNHGEPQGTWCDWTFESIPSFDPIEGAEERAFRFKENVAGDGMELRLEADVLADPFGTAE